MLQVKSFPITDDVGINNLLKEFRMAAGAAILVTDGHVCIPYEDGSEATASQKRALLAEQKANMQTQLMLLEHSNKVLERQLADFQAAADVADHNFKKAPNDKALEQKYKQAQNMADQNASQILANTLEIDRMNINIELFEEAIAALK